MSRKMTAKRALAKAFMWLEAAEHLRLDVSDDSLEQREAKSIADQLERTADRWFARAEQLRELEETAG